LAESARVTLTSGKPAAAAAPAVPAMRNTSRRLLPFRRAFLSCVLSLI
jgi:hypothetical protein